MSGRKKNRQDLRRERRPSKHQCWNHLIAAPLWPKYTVNLGTLLRTCDAVGACIAVPPTNRARDSLQRGDTLGGKRPCVHWANRPEQWLEVQRERGSRIVGVELAEEATRLADLSLAQERTIVVLGHEAEGIPEEVWELIDEMVEIPMIGSGSSLNVAVAGSLVLYKLAGLL